MKSVGCVGIGIMGTRDGCDQAQYGDVVAVCDVDLGRAEAAKANPELGKGKADVYQDYRKVLERKDIDVISISTPVAYAPPCASTSASNRIVTTNEMIV